MQQPPNEGVATFTRQCVGGRNLNYRLKVIQQPEKARACGSGPRSSADRRPVDPPPVVRLTVYENGEDITVKYDAGFMLYASLDVARPIANGRMHSAQILPVLTGVAVAGMAYLERPKQAGYFIFPDLSVRHEGWYRLRFHLFEQVKHPADADYDRPFENRLSSTSDDPTEPAQHEAMANRMYVHSAPFQVFGAKKFPGLNTSTELSKVVAEQGCRVRIRREIRQRRKPKTKEDGEEDTRKPSNASPVTAPDRLMSRDGAEASRQQLMPAEMMSSSAPIVNQGLNKPQPLMAPAPCRQTEQRSIFRPENDGTTSSSASHTSTSMSNFPRNVTPSAKQLPFTLPPISSLCDVGPSVTPRPRAYNLPGPTSQKRSYSPRTFTQGLALKDGARPDSTPAPEAPKTYQSSSWSNGQKPQPLNGHGQVIEADADAPGNASDGEGSILEGAYTYRRADGSRSRRLPATFAPY